MGSFPFSSAPIIVVVVVVVGVAVPCKKKKLLAFCWRPFQGCFWEGKNEIIFPEWKRRWNGKRRFQRRSPPLSCKKDFVKILLFYTSGPERASPKFSAGVLVRENGSAIFLCVFVWVCNHLFYALWILFSHAVCVLWGGRRGAERETGGGGFFCIVVVVKTAAAFLFHFCFFCKAIYV